MTSPAINASVLTIPMTGAYLHNITDITSLSEMHEPVQRRDSYRSVLREAMERYLDLNRSQQIYPQTDSQNAGLLTAASEVIASIDRDIPIVTHGQYVNRILLNHILAEFYENLLRGYDSWRSRTIYAFDLPKVQLLTKPKTTRTPLENFACRLSRPRMVFVPMQDEMQWLHTSYQYKEYMAPPVSIISARTVSKFIYCDRFYDMGMLAREVESSVRAHFLYIGEAKNAYRSALPDISVRECPMTAPQRSHTLNTINESEANLHPQSATTSPLKPESAPVLEEDSMTTASILEKRARLKAIKSMSREEAVKSLSKDKLKSRIRSLFSDVSKEASD